ncbi:MAG: dihydroneopterin aldolase [Chloroflexi bacterium]|nr:dihydroneopterin aldolase [Chloroflexota bacterium]
MSASTNKTSCSISSSTPTSARRHVSDDIADATNYKTITKRIIAHVEASSDFLVEKMVTDIARLVITEFGVERVIVRLEKPGALRFADSVGIEIERTKEEFV